MEQKYIWHQDRPETDKVINKLDYIYDGSKPQSEKIFI